MFNTDDIRIKELRPLISPALVMEEFPLSTAGANTILEARLQATDIIEGKDDRLLVVVGPCSIHDSKAALEYAQNLLPLAQELNNELLIVMRIYFEKPRTIVGWKGLINDPDLNGSFNINKGLRIARKLLLDLANMGLPAGCEFLDTIVPQYISDLVSWGAIGARTTESQIHRELASGLSMPIGFKNPTYGNIQVAIDAIRAALQPHHFLSVTKHGIAAIVSTQGNKDCHVILRGSSLGPNYTSEHVKQTTKLLTHANLVPKLMIDCSHGNSQKDHTKQIHVVENICEQITNDDKAICGVMLESNLVAGNQDLATTKKLVYGKSITDACISWDTTVPILEDLARAVMSRRNNYER